MVLIGSEQAVETASAWLDGQPMMGAFGRGARRFGSAGLDWKEGLSPVREGWHTSSAVAFVAQSFPTVRMDHPDAPVLAVLAKLLRSLYLHREIREKGGAYGGFALYNPETGIFSLASYRDPQIARTLAVYQEAGNFLDSGAITFQDVKEAILQVCADIDRPDPPAIEARKAFMRDLVGLSDARREAFKRNLLHVTPDRVLEVGRKYFGRQTDRAVAVIADRKQLEEANKELPRPLKLNPI